MYQNSLVQLLETQRGTGEHHVGVGVGVGVTTKTQDKGEGYNRGSSARCLGFPVKERHARGSAGTGESASANMDRLHRQRTAATLVHQAVEAQTQDHMDHTFAGVMFSVRSGQKLPYEYLEISTVWVRGGLGPISVWSTDGVRQTLERPSGARLSAPPAPRLPALESSPGPCMRPRSAVALACVSYLTPRTSPVRARPTPSGGRAAVQLVPGAQITDSRPGGQGFHGKREDEKQWEKHYQAYYEKCILQCLSL